MGTGDGVDAAMNDWISIIRIEGSDDCPESWHAHPEIDGCSASELAPCGGVARSAIFPVTRPYQQIRGYVLGYQYFSTDGFGRQHPAPVTIDGAYVDGISITTVEPRQHIWTLASGLNRDTGGSSFLCPCNGGTPAPDYVGANHYCDSGNLGPWESVWYTDDPLWDGNATGGDCSPPPEPNWFEGSLSEPTDQAIEIRILSDQCDELTGVSRLELFVR